MVCALFVLFPLLILIAVDILERIIEHLSSDEVRRFKILSNRFKADEEKKMLVLFDEIRGGDFKAREDQAIILLYGEVTSRSKNSYYRLRNKLLSSLEKSLLFYHFNYKNAIEAYSYIQLALLMAERGLHREAYYDLKKAEKAALVQEQFNVLEIVYDHMVQLAQHCEVDIAAVIERRKTNRGKLEVLRANREILGMLSSELSRRNYARSKRSHNVIETLETIRQQLEEHEEVFNSVSGRTMVMQTVISILLQKSAYGELAEYARQTFEEFEANGFFNRDNHALRLRLRVYRINALQKLLRLQEAEGETQAFFQDLKAYQSQNYQEFAFHYYSTRVFTLKHQGALPEADQLLRQALKQEDILIEKPYEIYLKISQADLLFLQGDYEAALDKVSRLQAHGSFAQLDEEMQLYLAVFGLINRYEAGQYVEAEVAYKEMRREHRALLRDEFYAHVRRFTDILMRLITAATDDKGMHLRATHRNFVRDFGPSEIGSNQIILYDVYLQGKAEEQPYAELLRKLVEKEEVMEA
jgi:hypothetical protein